MKSHSTLIIRLVTSVIVLSLLIIPLNGISLWRYGYGLTGELSPTLLMVALFWFFRPTSFASWIGKEVSGFNLIILTSLFLGIYWTTLIGRGDWEIYSWGFQPWEILFFLGLFVIFLGRDYPGITLILTMDLISYGLHLLASDNLWDYLFDPILTLVFMVTLSIRLALLFRNRLRALITHTGSGFRN
jgi:hypothetical protein